MMVFDATGIYLSAMWDENSVFLKKQTGFAFQPHMTDVYVEAFNIQSVNKNGNESAILKTKYYNPPNPIFQHLPVRGKVKNIEVDRMRSGYIIDSLTSVDFQEVVQKGRKVIRVYEGLLIEKSIRYRLLHM